MALTGRFQSHIMQQLNSLRMTKLTWREPAPASGFKGELAPLRPDRGR
ncbi:MAG TPA: hypothetical protein VGI55_04065 [Solirubrobacteraceae bacterium]